LGSCPSSIINLTDKINDQSDGRKVHINSRPRKQISLAIDTRQYDHSYIYIYSSHSEETTVITILNISFSSYINK